MSFTFQEEGDHARDVVEFGQIAPAERDGRGMKCRAPGGGCSHNPKAAAEGLVDNLFQ